MVAKTWWCHMQEWWMIAVSAPERHTCLAGVLLTAIVGGGCAPTAVLVKVRSIEMSDALVERFAGTVGVHFPAEFRNYVGSDKFSLNGDIMQTPLGEPSVAMFENSLATLFQNVEVLAEWPTKKPIGAGVDLVVMPRIESFSILFPMGGSGYQVRVGYALGLYTPTGDELANWSFIGSGDVELRILFVPRDHSHFGRGIGLALRDASAQLLARLSTHPMVVARFKQVPSMYAP
jgi:hypothetical protein